MFSPVVNRCVYFSKVSKILEDTSKFERVDIEERKALNPQKLKLEVLKENKN